MYLNGRHYVREGTGMQPFCPLAKFSVLAPLLGKPSKCTFFSRCDIALFRTPVSHFSKLTYRTFQNSHIALFRTPISHFSELRYRTFGPHIGVFAFVRNR